MHDGWIKRTDMLQRRNTFHPLTIDPLKMIIFYRMRAIDNP